MAKAKKDVAACLANISYMYIDFYFIEGHMRELNRQQNVENNRPLFLR